MDNYIYLICQDFEPPCAAVLTEADAEELFMDLVMEWRYEIYMYKFNDEGYSEEELKEFDWIWEMNGPYYITRAPKLY